MIVTPKQFSTPSTPPVIACLDRLAEISAMLKALATDLDGTLIPLDRNSQQQQDLKTLTAVLDEHRIDLLFVTGRHPESAIAAIDEHHLPRPDCIICNVGTTILRRVENGGFQHVDRYQQKLASIVGDVQRDGLHDLLSCVAGLRRQEEFKQARYKLSYYVDSKLIKTCTQQVRSLLLQNQAPWAVISSVDPFNGDGLMDLLPQGVSKSFAIDWWLQQNGLTSEQIAFAGDSGNDIAALTAGWKAILVANASPDVVAEVIRISDASDQRKSIFFSTQQASSGVLEGLRHFCR